MKHNILRKVFSGILSMAVVLSLFIGSATPAAAATYNLTVTTEGELDFAVTTGTLDGTGTLASGDIVNVTVASNITITKPINLVGGTTVTIASDTGQRTLTRGPSYTTQFFVLNNVNETLTLQDIVLDGTGAGVTTMLIQDVGTVNLRGASILQNNHNTTNANTLAGATGAIYVGASSQLNMYDTAQISGNSSVHTNMSGGVYLSTGATMTMNDSSQVEGNTGARAGGIYMGGNATLAMHDDSKVAGNSGTNTGTATSTGGIFAGTGAQITMDGNASVTGNNAQTWGGGIHLTGPNHAWAPNTQIPTPGVGSFLTMTDNASVTGNHSNGNGGGISASSGSVVTIEGSAKLSDNTAKVVGGIYVVTFGTLLIKDNAVVSGNVGESYVGGIDINTGGSIHITDNAQVINNKTTGTYDDTANTGMLLGAGGIYINAHTIDPNTGNTISSESVNALIDGNVIISGNTAASNGGGIYIDYFEADEPGFPPVRVEGNVQITNNSAPNGDGGGIYVGVYQDPTDITARNPELYRRLNVGADVVFANNSAQAAYLLTDPALIAIHDATVLTHSFTTPFTYGYSNYDINYIEGDLAYIVTFDSQGGAPVVKSNPTFINNQEAVAAETPAVKPAIDPTKARGDIFGGWYTDPACTTPYDFSTLVTADITLYAKWSPVAVNDSATTKAGQTLAIADPTKGLLPNDSGTGLKVADFTQPKDSKGAAQGNVTVNADGTYTYTPTDPNFSGKVTFDYTIVNDQGFTSTATVTINITPLGQDDSATVKTGHSVKIPVLSNDTGTGLTVQSATKPKHGKVTINPDGTVTYKSDKSGFSGIDTFAYTAVDSSGNPITQTVTVTVLPQAYDDKVTTNVDTPVNDSVLPNDKGIGLKVTDHTKPAHGKVVIHRDGTFTYTPDKGYTGKDSYTYTITDKKGNISTATVRITVLPKASNAGVVTKTDTPATGDSSDAGLYAGIAIAAALLAAGAILLRRKRQDLS